MIAGVILQDPVGFQIFERSVGAEFHSVAAQAEAGGDIAPDIDIAGGIAYESEFSLCEIPYGLAACLLYAGAEP